MNQKEVFLHHEGDSYFERNRKKLVTLGENAVHDNVINVLKAFPFAFHDVLEIGCSNGWRLDALRREYHASCYGIDPSSEAIEEGREAFPNIFLQQGTADLLAFDGVCIVHLKRPHARLMRIWISVRKWWAEIQDDEVPSLLQDAISFTGNLKQVTSVTQVETETEDNKIKCSMFLWNPSYSLLSHTTFTPRKISSPERRPVEKRDAKVDHGGVEAVELVLEPELLAGGNGTANAEELIEYFLVQLPRALLVGVGQGGSAGRCVYAEMLQFSEAA